MFHNYIILAYDKEFIFLYHISIKTVSHPNIDSVEGHCSGGTHIDRRAGFVCFVPTKQCDLHWVILNTETRLTLWPRWHPDHPYYPGGLVVQEALEGTPPWFIRRISGVVYPPYVWRTCPPDFWRTCPPVLWRIPLGLDSYTDVLESHLYPIPYRLSIYL